MTPEMGDSLTPHLQKNKPNTYIYTKALAENLISDRVESLNVYTYLLEHLHSHAADDSVLGHLFKGTMFESCTGEIYRCGLHTIPGKSVFFSGD